MSSRITPRYTYCSSTAADFVNEFGPSSANWKPDLSDIDDPIIIKQIGTEGTTFPVVKALLKSAQFVRFPANADDPEHTPRTEFWITVRVLADEVTGHPGYKVTFSLPHDASVGFEAPVTV